MMKFRRILLWLVAKVGGLDKGKVGGLDKGKVGGLDNFDKRGQEQIHRRKRILGKILKKSIQQCTSVPQIVEVLCKAAPSYLFPITSDTTTLLLLGQHNGRAVAVWRQYLEKQLEPRPEEAISI
jgi:hypothetical protein